MPGLCACVAGLRMEEYDRKAIVKGVEYEGEFEDCRCRMRTGQSFEIATRRRPGGRRSMSLSSSHSRKAAVCYMYNMVITVLPPSIQPTK